MHEVEQQLWGNCTNTFGEETKQLVMAKRMGLVTYHDGRSPINIDMSGKTILDIGGGPVSLLLKCTGLQQGFIMDPGVWPEWVYERYKSAGLDYVALRGEDITDRYGMFDEIWIYNVLQHVEDPEKILTNALALTKTIRLFEWINLPPHPGHPNELKAGVLDRILGSRGQIDWLDESGCVGLAYYGVWNYAND